MREYYKALKDALLKGSVIRKTCLNNGAEAIFKDGEMISKTDGFVGENTIDEIITIRPTLVLFGFGHIGKAVYKIATLLDMSLFIFDDRKEILKDGSYDKATIVIESYENIFKNTYHFENPYFLIFTHGHKYDEEALNYVIRNYSSSYIGMIGSKNKIAICYDHLEKRGIEREKLDRVKAPIGLKINAKTPEEIAISIMAEIIDTYREDKHQITYDLGLIDYILSTNEELILARIIEKEGSGPREKGSEMLISSSSTYSTIGGGAIELSTIERARNMLKEGSTFEIEYYILKENESLNMACGGRAKVLFKLI